MWAVKRLQRQILKPLPLLSDRCFLQRELPLHLKGKDDILPISVGKAKPCPTFPLCSVSGIRLMSTTRGRSMRSKVEKRMQRETGKTMREIRRAKKLRKKLMTEEERLIYNLRRAKKKVALLLQKLKKYELPEFPAPRHDPELLTAEQLQAYKKIGFRNRNYMLVGVRGVFGGVILNMHLHWKHHETVQVCCDNFPKEKIKEMATMLARLSGGIVINIHNVKTIIMFRGRNYRQPKIMEPFNTLTKRKALFRARFEQALDSQKLNIKKIEQQLRRKGVNPEDPIAMASIQRVASTFFRAIDERQGTPYVFRGDRQPYAADDAQENVDDQQTELSLQDSDQEELDRFIAEIEDAADEEWAAEEAAEREEASRIRYWGNEEEGMMRGQKSNWRNGKFEDNHRTGHESMKRAANIGKWDSSDDVLEASDAEGEGGSEDEDEEDIRVKSPRNRPDKGEISYARTGGKLSEAVSGSESEMFGGSEGDDLWESEDEKEHDRLARSESEKLAGGKPPKFDAYDYDSGSEYNDEEKFGDKAESRGQSFQDTKKKRKDEQWDSD